MTEMRYVSSEWDRRHVHGVFTCVRGGCGILGAPARAQQPEGTPPGVIRDAEIEQLMRDYAHPLMRAAGVNVGATKIFLINDRGFNAFVANGPVQYALADYMKNKDAYLSLTAFYQKKRDFFLQHLEGSRFKPLRTRGTFFQNLAYDAISDEKDTELAIRLTRDHGVAAIPVSVFYARPRQDRVLRFCFAKQEDTLARAAERLARL